MAGDVHAGSLAHGQVNMPPAYRLRHTKEFSVELPGMLYVLRKA